MDAAPAREDRRRARLGEVAAAVFWALFGVRKRRSLEQDAARIRPHQVVIVGVAAALLFVGLLIVLARLVVRAAG